MPDGPTYGDVGLPNPYTAKQVITDLRAEIERLRALVRSAYAEGFSEGMNEHTKFRGGKPWEDSRACRALEEK